MQTQSLIVLTHFLHSEGDSFIPYHCRKRQFNAFVLHRYFLVLKNQMLRECQILFNFINCTVFALLWFMCGTFRFLFTVFWGHTRKQIRQSHVVMDVTKIKPPKQIFSVVLVLYECILMSLYACLHTKWYHFIEIQKFLAPLLE